MTKLATIKELNLKISTLANAVSEQMSTMRHGIGSILGISHDGKRDIYDIYGYPETLGGTYGYLTMKGKAGRAGISNLLTYGHAKKCWRQGFDIYSGAGESADNIGEDIVNALKKAGFLKKMESADVLNRIGRMSVLYVGVPDGRQPEEELGRVPMGEKFIDKLYFVPYEYDGIVITEQETDPTNPRYGLPKFYTLQKTGNSDNEKDTMNKSIVAHWSRVIHLNENGLNSDIEGMGALEPIFNNILDIEKTIGGSSEAYFRNARGKIAYEIDKDFATSIATSGPAKDAFNEGAEEFANNWKDHILAVGSKAKGIDTPHHSPLDTVKVALWSIAGQTEYRIRILTGEGAGQLAGSEDQASLNQIIKDRQDGPCTDWINRFMEILTEAGMISLPDGYEIRFPLQEATTEDQKAKTGLAKAQTLQAVATAKSSIGGDAIDMETALEACGLEDIEVDESAPDSDLEDAELEEPAENPND